MLVLTSVVPCGPAMYTLNAAGEVLTEAVLQSTTVYSSGTAVALRLLVACVAAAVVKLVTKPIAVKIFTTLVKSGGYLLCYGLWLDVCADVSVLFDPLSH